MKTLILSDKDYQSLLDILQAEIEQTEEDEKEYKEWGNVENIKNSKKWKSHCQTLLIRLQKGIK